MKWHFNVLICNSLFTSDRDRSILSVYWPFAFLLFFKIGHWFIWQCSIDHVLVCVGVLYIFWVLILCQSVAHPVSFIPFNCSFKLMKLLDECLIFLLDNESMRRGTISCNKCNINTYREVNKYFWLKCVDNWLIIIIIINVFSLLPLAFPLSCLRAGVWWYFISLCPQCPLKHSALITEHASSGF